MRPCSGKITFLCLLTMVCCTVGVESAPSEHGFPDRISSLTDLQPLLRRQDVTNAQKTEVLLYWLAKELEEPSPTTTGVGGYPIDSGYIRAQFLMAFREVGDAFVLDAILSDATVDAGFKDYIRVGLGLMGDRRQITAVIGILRRHSDPNLRVMAARATNWLGSTESIPALEAASQDSFEVHPTRAPMKDGKHTTPGLFPIQDEIQQSLRNLRNSDYQRREKQRAESFTAHLERTLKEAPRWKVSPWVLEAIRSAAKSPTAPPAR